MTQQYATESADVVVIGGGPGGSAAAIHLAQAGLHVVQLERRDFLAPGNDALRSGEGLIPSARRALKAIGLETQNAAWSLSLVRQLCIHWPNHEHTVNPLERRGGVVLINRELLDAAIFAVAQQRGADSRPRWRALHFHRDANNAVAGVVAQPPDGLPPRLILAPLVLDAGGRNALALREFDLRRHDAAGDFYSMALYFDKVADLAPDAWEMHLFGPKQLNVIQLSQFQDGLVRCGLGTAQSVQQQGPNDPHAFFWSCLQGHPELSERLRGARVVRRPFVRARIGYHVRQVALDGLLLVGDAAGYINPLFGDGIPRALESGRIAATAAIAALRNGRYSRSHLAIYERYQRRRRFQDWVLKQGLVWMYSHPKTLATVGQTPIARQGLLAALMRP